MLKRIPKEKEFILTVINQEFDLFKDYINQGVHLNQYWIEFIIRYGSLDMCEHLFNYNQNKEKIPHNKKIDYFQFVLFAIWGDNRDFLSSLLNKIEADLMKNRIQGFLTKSVDANSEDCFLELFSYSKNNFDKNKHQSHCNYAYARMIEVDYFFNLEEVYKIDKLFSLFKYLNNKGVINAKFEMRQSRSFKGYLTLFKDYIRISNKEEFDLNKFDKDQKDVLLPILI